MCDVLTLLVMCLCVTAGRAQYVRLEHYAIASQVVEFVDVIGREDVNLTNLLLTTRPFDGTVQTQAMLASHFAARVARPDVAPCDAFGMAAASLLTIMRTKGWPYDVLPAPYDTLRPVTVAQAHYRALCHSAGIATPLSDGVRDTLLALSRIAIGYIIPR